MAVTLAQVRTMALALPETAEVVTWGTDLTWRVRDRMFAVGGPDSPSISVKASKEDQAELIAMAPDVYSYAAYVGRFGWVTVQLAKASRAELSELITEAWRRTAPKRLVAAFDDGHTS
jgi:hypothetical protein